MNFVGHIEVAGRLRTASGPATPEFLIGSALPDFAAIGRFRLTEAATEASPGLADGLNVHHRTDDSFHRHSWFREANEAVTDRLQALGVARGPAMACGHVGVELLLDGLLLDRDDALRGRVEQSMAAVGDPALGLRSLVADEHRDRWADHLVRIARWPLPLDYREPAAVARRLARILSARPRLALPDHQIDQVTFALTEQQPRLEAGADALINDLVDQVGAAVADG